MREADDPALKPWRHSQPVSSPKAGPCALPGRPHPIRTLTIGCAPAGRRPPMPHENVETIRTAFATAPAVKNDALWPEPDLSVLKEGRRDAPPLPLQMFAPAWAEWLTRAAEGANAPVDYAAMS